MERERPSPEALLPLAEAEGHRRGRLTIFLGYAPGVGKTYAMLEAALERLREGLDVVAAYVDTHGRPETEALLSGLPILPRRKVRYRDLVLEELDLDALLRRRPRLALIDELAHTNAPGSRHAKRYQDVEEVLDAGIDVYTTLNIQHLESLVDVVAQITGIRVRETVPDRILEEADDVKLVDLPPEELLRRLAEGKVYVPDLAQEAMRRFFRLGNLVALRELALRITAQRVDRQMRRYMASRAIAGPWPAAERLLVCVGTGPLKEQLVRAGYRLASALDADWHVVFVETPEHATLPLEEREGIARALRLAQQLGARVETLRGESPPQEILRYARTHNITKILAGASHRPWWQRLLRGSLVDWLLHNAGAIEVYVISAPVPKVEPTTRPMMLRAPVDIRSYLAGFGLVGLVTLISALLHRFVDPTNLTMLYLLAVVVAALRWGRGPAVLTAVAGVAAFDFFFVPPRLTFAVSDVQYLLTFAGFLAVGLVISALASRARDQAEAARQREAHTATLYALSRELASHWELPRILDAVLRHVAATFGGRAVILLPEEGRLEPHGPEDLPLDDVERAAAEWAFSHRSVCGRGTDHLPDARGLYVPLQTAQAVRGVLGVRVDDPARLLLPPQRQLLEAIATLAAIAIERAQLAEEARRAELLREVEKLQRALLDSVSHELRTPLVSITATLTSLTEGDVRLDEPTRRELLLAARLEAERLNRLVSNLLDMTRLEAGALRLRWQPVDVEDLVGTALAELSAALDGRRVEVRIPAELPLARGDPVLLARALANVVDNALKYSPQDAPVEILARTANGWVEVEVADAGPGIPPEALPHIFEAFYRATGSRGGVGLGLAIAKGIVEAHGGRIRAENRPEGGLRVLLTLPRWEPDGAGAFHDGLREAARLGR
jgi:two-component system sensor histidine kinase KdpD